MTEDQIKAIAEKFNKEYYTPISWNDLITFLRFLSDKYCIVEREKVIDEYKEACDEIDFETENKSVLHQNVALGRKCLLESLFGTSMFNQNGEK